MSYRDDVERREVYLSRIATGLLNAHIYPTLKEAIKAARVILAEHGDIKTDAELIKVMELSGKEVSKTLKQGWAEAENGMMVMALYESSYSAKIAEQLTDKPLVVPADKTIKSFIDKSLMTLQTNTRVTSNFFEEYIKANNSAYVDIVKGEMAKGYRNGSSNNEIIAAIEEMTNTVGSRDAETLVRTGANYYANQAREAMAAANDDVITYFEHEAVFDNRTCLICRPLDGKRYPQGAKKPSLPIHFSCRCFYSMGTGDINEKNTGTKSSVGGNAAKINPKRKLKYRGKRDADIFNAGQIPAGISQDEWLRKQPVWFIESSLGKTRAKLFKDGGLKIEKFVDMAGNPLTLDELKAIDAKSFKKAGL